MIPVTILTAIYDRYDPLPTVVPQDDADVEWVCVTDDPNLAGEGWRILHRPRPDLTPRDAGYQPKLRPWGYVDRPNTIWMDASCQVTSPRWVADVFEYAMPLAQFAHPERDCLFDEVDVCVTLPRYQHVADGFRSQAAHYWAAGHPEHWGLWCATVIARRHTHDVFAHGEAWAAEVARWPSSDQHAEPFVSRRVGLRPHVIPGDFRASGWFTRTPSERHYQ